MRTILIRQGDKLHSESEPGLRVPHYRVHANLPFRNQKCQLRLRPDRLRHLCLDEYPARAQIPHARNVIASMASPHHPHVLRCLRTRSQPSRDGAAPHRTHTSPARLESALEIAAGRFSQQESTSHSIKAQAAPASGKRGTDAQETTSPAIRGSHTRNSQVRIKLRLWMRRMTRMEGDWLPNAPSRTMLASETSARTAP